ISAPAPLPAAYTELTRIHNGTVTAWRCPMPPHPITRAGSSREPEPDLVTRLEDTAVSAIRAEAAELQRDPERLRGIGRGLARDPSGGVREGTVCIERTLGRADRHA